MTATEMVREFHQAFGVAIADRPAIPDGDTEALRYALIQEEYREWHRAQANADLAEIAKELADLVYVIYGTALAYGIPLDAVLAEVHRSNMTKLDADGKPIFREDGKVLKSELYQEPDIAEVLGGVA